MGKSHVPISSPHHNSLLYSTLLCGLVPLPLSHPNQTMAHRATTHRRSSALPHPKPLPSPNPADPSLPFTTKRVNPPPSATDVRLLSKSLSVSSIFDSLSKPRRTPSATKTKKAVKDKLVDCSAAGMRKLTVSVDGGGRRRSAQVDVADFLANNGARIVSVDMPPFMQIHAVDFARKTHDSLEKFTARTLASTLKKEFDQVYGPAWHCIVGTSFGSFVTHSVGGFMYFSLDQKMYILLFKTTVQRATD